MDPVLSSNDIDFLCDNFSLLEVGSNRESHDFSCLSEAKVILIGEWHSSPVLQKAQLEFLRIFSKGNACLLQEGVAPGVEISQDALERFTGFTQKIRILGSDNRQSRSRDEATTFLNSSHQITESVSEFSRRLKEFAGYVNSLYNEKKNNHRRCDFHSFTASSR